MLPAFPASLSRKARQALERLGVTPLPGHTVVDIGPQTVAMTTWESRATGAYASTGPVE